MSFDFLYQPVEHLDGSLTGLFDGAGLLVALALAFLLGLRHASDPDHLVAVSALVASDEPGTREAARLGTWWGAGHAVTLLAVGLPLIAFAAELPSWLETGAERAVGVVILVLAARMLLTRRRRSRHEEPAPTHIRGRRAAFAIGVLHGLAGSGTVAVLLITALPTQLGAAAALAVFAPMSAVSMTACTAGFAWIIGRPRLGRTFDAAILPALGAISLLFGAWYAGVA